MGDLDARAGGGLLDQGADPPDDRDRVTADRLAEDRAADTGVSGASAQAPALAVAEPLSPSTGMATAVAANTVSNLRGMVTPYEGAGKWQATG